MDHGRSSSSSSSDDYTTNIVDDETQVLLNVYDLTPLNKYLFCFGLGVFHSGIEVYGMEYGFGAHDLSMSGVFEAEPKSCPGFIYRCSIPLGRIGMPFSEFHHFLETVASEYHGDTYHLISKNCNHFTDDMSCRLTGNRIPGWVNRLAKLGSICSCLLPESLQVTTVKHLPEYHPCAENDVAESILVSTPKISTEVDDLEKDRIQLISPPGSGEVSFIREATRRS
ncbi:deSI-like protein At4g17486 [Apium graveolens]|uniref:deSI-like protein At4g17486 n=1 Tax=Apium graveolens TaxID=4045 RepID=UPI003D7A5C0A